MTREEVLRQVLRAQTREDIEKAQRAADRWLKDHPHDLRVLSAMEQLYMMGEALKQRTA